MEIMKTLLICLLIVFTSEFVTFSRWECAIIESKYKDGRTEYSALYKGKEYVLTWDQYCDLLAGKDVTIKVEPTKNKDNEKDYNQDSRRSGIDN